MLFIDRAERADVLAYALARLLVRPRPDPFATDLVAVPTRGIERWLAQTLATRLGSGGAAQDGVCANISFPSPQGLVRDTLAKATGLEPEHDPWRRERTSWGLPRKLRTHCGLPGVRSGRCDSFSGPGEWVDGAMTSRDAGSRRSRSFGAAGADRLPGEGYELPDVIKDLEVSEQKLYRSHNHSVALRPTI